jgi:hypothetical protein
MRIVKYLGIIMIALLGFGSAAQGGLLPTDPQAYNDGTMTWSGTQAYAAGSGTNSLKTTVDYAVYAPGQFNNSSALGNPTDPSGGSQYVYAYQLWNNTGGSLAISAFTLGFADAADSDKGTEAADKQPANIGYLAGTPSGDPPTGEAFTYAGGSGPAQSGVWNFSGGVPAGDHSNVLIFTSPYPPEFDLGTVQGGRTSTQMLPSPVPEPASSLLLFFFAAAFLAATRTWRQHR